MKPICVPCQRFYRPKKNGFHFIEGMPTNGAEPGLRAPHLWRPYKLWQGDLWHCPDCKGEIVVGTGFEPISEHYKPEFQAEVDSRGKDLLLVKDC